MGGETLKRFGIHLIKTVIKTSSTVKDIDEFKMKLNVRFEHPNT